MTINELVALRKNLDLSQTAMAERMGLSLSALQAVEGGKARLSARHVALAERAALALAVERGDPMLAPASVRREALALARLITGE